MVPGSRDEGKMTRTLHTTQVVFRRRIFLLAVCVALVHHIYHPNGDYTILVLDEPRSLLLEWQGSRSRHRHNPIPLARGDACEARGGG